MSIVYCHNCNKDIDTDFNVEHFNEDEECIKSQEIMVNKAEYIELEEKHNNMKTALIIMARALKIASLLSDKTKAFDEIYIDIINVLKQAK